MRTHRAEAEWTRQFGTTGIDSAFPSGVTAHRKGVDFAGITDGQFALETNAGQSDAFVVHYGGDGRRRWLQQIGTTGDEEDAAIASGGVGAFYSGDTGGTFPGETNAGGADIYIAKP